MYKLAKDDDLDRIIKAIYDEGGIVAAECHGPAPQVSIIGYFFYDKFRGYGHMPIKRS